MASTTRTNRAFEDVVVAPLDQDTPCVIIGSRNKLQSGL